MRQQTKNPKNSGNCSLGTLVTTYETIRRHNPEDNNLKLWQCSSTLTTTSSTVWPFATSHQLTAATIQLQWNVYIRAYKYIWFWMKLKPTSKELTVFKAHWLILWRAYCRQYGMGLQPSLGNEHARNNGAAVKVFSLESVPVVTSCNSGGIGDVFFVVRSPAI
jgi:hypothetical protein